MKNSLLHTPAGIFRWHENWVSVPSASAGSRNRRTHGVVIGRDGRVYVFHQAKPAMLVYERSGQLCASWGNYLGAHGLTLVEEDGKEYLWLTDQDAGLVEKTTTDGKVLCRIDAPPYAENEPYVPTWVAVNEIRHGGNGDVWVADGYGSSRVNRYNSDGQFLSTLDGTGGGGRFNCPHGIWFDCRRAPTALYIADRGNRRVQVYDEHGGYSRSFGEDFLSSPDGFVVDGDRLIIPELHGRVTVLDADDRLLCHLGANEEASNDPWWPDGNILVPGRFNSPHAAAVDGSHNLYVVEWRVGGRVLKLEKLR